MWKSALTFALPFFILFFYSLSGLLIFFFLVWSQRLPLFTVAIKYPDKKNAYSAVLHFCIQTVRLPPRALIKFTKRLWETTITLLYPQYGNYLFTTTLFPLTCNGLKHCLSLKLCYWVHSKPTDLILQLYRMFQHATYLCMQGSVYIRNTINIKHITENSSSE